MRITYVGGLTALIELDGWRLLMDPSRKLAAPRVRPPNWIGDS